MKQELDRTLRFLDGWASLSELNLVSVHSEILPRCVGGPEINLRNTSQYWDAGSLFKCAERTAVSWRGC